MDFPWFSNPQNHRRIRPFRSSDEVVQMLKAYAVIGVRNMEAFENADVKGETSHRHT